MVRKFYGLEWWWGDWRLGDTDLFTLEEAEARAKFYSDSLCTPYRVFSYEKGEGKVGVLNARYEASFCNGKKYIEKDPYYNGCVWALNHTKKEGGKTNDRAKRG